MSDNNRNNNTINPRNDQCPSQPPREFNNQSEYYTDNYRCRDRHQHKHHHCHDNQQQHRCRNGVCWL